MMMMMKKLFIFVGSCGSSGLYDYDGFNSSSITIKIKSVFFFQIMIPRLVIETATTSAVIGSMS